MMRIIILLLCIWCTVHATVAQQSDVCTISAVVVQSNAKLSDVDKYPQVELGKVDISHVNEGTRLPNTFRVPGAGLYAYVEIFFDDDMMFYDSLHDALTVNIVLSTAKKRTKNSVVGLTTTSVAFDENFKQADVIGFAKTLKHRVGVIVSCRGAKPKDG